MTRNKLVGTYTKSIVKDVCSTEPTKDGRLQPETSGGKETVRVKEERQLNTRHSKSNRKLKLTISKLAVKILAVPPTETSTGM